MAADAATLERLRNGARIMAELWRSGQRCTAAWSASGACACPKRSKFCVARRQWIDLMLETDSDNQARGIEADDSEDHPFALFEAMLSSELAATGFTIHVENGVKVGPAGSATVKLAVEVVSGDAGGAAPLATLLRTFKGAKITKVERDPQVTA